MATPKELAEFYASAPKENAVCELDFGGYVTNKHGPNLNSDITNWRWRPQAKVIDMSCLVGSDVLCEFWDNESYLFLDTLRSINGDGRYIANNLVSGWRYCRPVFHRWHAHTGDTQPIPDGFMVEVSWRGDRQTAVCSSKCCWSSDGVEGDFLFYRIVGIAEGWENGIR